VQDTLGSCLVSVPPSVALAAVDVAALGYDALLAALPGLLGQKPRRIADAVFRWTERPADLDDAGEWVTSAQPGLPDWLHPFRSRVLVARAADGTFLSAVGIKHHNAYGKELAVGTAPGAEGRGLARRLVAQAARAVLAGGALPTYLHEPSNVASGRVADAAGFPDRGWSAFGLADKEADDD
jgi:GNAT superfamily N-acetyltransferase